MKERLSKTLSRLKKEKIIKNSDDEQKNTSLKAYEIKVFRSLRDKYDISLSVNNSKDDDDIKEKKLSDEAEITLERIKKGEYFKL
tara:strand:+ start:442 stop:696 length:255 start_codon:yes stop_codon:yes gene_type:complete